MNNVIIMQKGGDIRFDEFDFPNQFPARDFEEEFGVKIENDPMRVTAFF